MLLNGGGQLRADTAIAPAFFDGHNTVGFANRGQHRFKVERSYCAQVDNFGVDAFRTAEGEERDRCWALATEGWPNYDDYQKRTDRVIPVVVLERAAQ